jgi:hypothetical protein
LADSTGPGSKSLRLLELAQFHTGAAKDKWLFVQSHLQSANKFSLPTGNPQLFDEFYMILSKVRYSMRL